MLHISVRPASHAVKVPFKEGPFLAVPTLLSSVSTAESILTPAGERNRVSLARHL